MKKSKYIYLLFLILSLVGVCKSINEQIVVSIEHLEIYGVGITAMTNITISSLPKGLSGYNITISISDPSIAEINSVNFPEWASLHANSSLPSSSVWIKGVDLNKNIEAGATNIILATIVIKSKNEGLSSLNISVTKIDDDEGYPINVTVENATIVVMENRPPVKPYNPYPQNGATDISLDISLSWQCYDEDNDALTYDIYFGTSSTPPKVASNIATNSYHVSNLKYATTYYWKIVAYDEHGVKNESDLWSFTTKAYSPPPPPSPSPNHPPIVAIDYPIDGATVNGIITIQGKASDIDGNETIQKVEVKIDNGAWNIANGTNSWSYVWNTTQFENGNHTIYARAYDGKDYSNIASINVNVFNNHKPSIEITEPEDGSVVNGSVTIKGKAWDIDGNETLQKVEVKIGEENWIVVSGVVNWNYTWDTKKVKNGEYVIMARAYDGYDYSEIVSITIKVNNKKIPGFEFIPLLITFLVILLIRKKRFNSKNEENYSK